MVDSLMQCAYVHSHGERCQLPPSLHDGRFIRHHEFQVLPDVTVPTYDDCPVHSDPPHPAANTCVCPRPKATAFDENSSRGCPQCPHKQNAHVRDGNVYECWANDHCPCVVVAEEDILHTAKSQVGKHAAKPWHYISDDPKTCICHECRLAREVVRLSELERDLVAVLERLPVVNYDNGYRIQALPKAELLGILARAKTKIRA